MPALVWQFLYTTLTAESRFVRQQIGVTPALLQIMTGISPKPVLGNPILKCAYAIAFHDPKSVREKDIGKEIGN